MSEDIPLNTGWGFRFVFYGAMLITELLQEQFTQAYTDYSKLDVVLIQVQAANSYLAEMIRQLAPVSVLASWS